jgi:hypothetical protein
MDPTVAQLLNPNLPIPDPTQSTLSMDASYADPSMGLPVGDPYGTNPIAQTPNPAPAGGGIIASVESALSQAASDTKSAVIGTYGVVKSVVSTVGNDVLSGAGAVVDTASKPINKLYWGLIIGVAVLGGVIYFAGKSGAVHANIGVPL